MNYRGEAGFGTIIGGFLSLVFNAFFLLFIFIQLYSWLFQASFNQSLSVTYLDNSEKTIYDIPATSFLPTCAVATFGRDGRIADANNRTDWSISYQIVYINGTKEQVEAVNCRDLIDSWTDVSESEKDVFRKEQLGFEEFLLCPNISSFLVEGSTYGKVNF